eukprot:g463.t1
MPKENAMKIACVAVIGKENTPLYIQTFPTSTEKVTEDELKFHLIVYRSLDSLPPNTRIQDDATSSKDLIASNKNQNRYLGSLGSIDKYVVFGYVTSSHNTFIAVLEETLESTVAEMRKVMEFFFLDCHTLYTQAVCNPFHGIHEAKIKSKRFDKEIEKLVTKFRKS